MTEWTVAAIVPALASAVLILALRRSPFASRLRDHPNERSLHVHPTPRVGGIALFLSATAVGLALTGSALAFAWLPALALAAVSFADDLRTLPVAVRLAAHALACAAALLAMPGALDLSPAILLVVVVAMAWMTNLYNFMDGSDGLAGGMAIVGFGAYAVAATRADLQALALCSAVIASASAGFLAFNFPPARIFMGDAGSIPLGFLAASLGAHGAFAGAWPAWFPMLVFSPFIVDASVTLAKRLARGERVWRAHREHYYQRLVLGGWSPRQVAGAFYALMLAAAIGALAAREGGWILRCVILLIWFAIAVLAMIAVDRWRR